MSDLQKEREIPVFTVWKNNAILKNIFLINSPPILDNNSNNNQDFEETLLVGRHPDCDIRLEHPSISRFHLRIHSLPASKSLFLTDLSSVHGTWVSDKRIEPDIRTKVEEGDSLRIGGSSRVYKLHWIPLSQAYDVSQSFVSPLDFVEQQEDEDEIIKNEISEGLKDEENDISDDIIKGLEALDFCGVDHQMVAENVLPRSPPLQPQKLVSVKNEAFELADSDFESLESLCLDEISIDIDQKDIRPENFESGGVESLAPTLEGLGDITRELEQNEMLPVPLVHNEDLKDEDVESMDSILEGLVPLFMGENWEWIGLEANYLPCPTEDHPQPSDEDHPALEELGTSNLDESSQLISQKATPLTPLMPDMKFTTLENLKNDETGLCSLDASFLDENSQCSVQKAAPSAPIMPDYVEVPTQDNVDNMTAEGEDFQDSAWSFWTAGGLLNTECDQPVMENDNTEVLSKRESLVTNCSDLNSSTKENKDTQLWSFWSGKMGVESVCSALSDIEPLSEAENKSMTNGYLSSSLNSVKSQKSARSLWSGRGKLESVCSALSDIEPFSEAENKSMANGYLNSSLNSLKSQKSARSFWSGRGKLESIGFSLSDAESLSASENESCGDGYQSPKSLSSVKGRFGSPLMASDQNPVDSIWSRRGKLDSVPLVLTSRTEEKKMKNNEEEVFTPDKENFNPTTHKSMRKLAVLKEISNSSPGKSPLLKMNCSPNNHHENFVSPLSNKENYSPRSRQKQKTASRASANRVESLKLKERKGRRMPFQSLLANSPQKSISECHIAEAETKTGSCVNAVACKGKCIKAELRQWNMIVDTTTLLNKESRKALQLLEGLKGTRLIIPRIVITELASLNRQVSFFRRNTEVQSALEWIQECMLRTGWWIHVQNSTEEGRPVAPTPPASPHHSQFYALSGFESQRELFSPTVEDDLLDYALGFRKNNLDGQLVLLSNDVTMKIKAMAEGMICETGDEFRESLVNPFSERFMWTDSCPRGQTWSCADDFVLKQKFYPSSLKMTPKSRENVKGLKLILLHNSRYHDRVTAIH
ncbi:FHA domain-containing protein PS1 isoform X2 [Silene latifolia]|uniref:FHA domain-containing protein PS1 isoform X2 n=1 Tax=Silene latifolia TaxID=37657 RepID=UPI003D77CF5F